MSVSGCRCEGVTARGMEYIASFGKRLVRLNVSHTHLEVRCGKESEAEGGGEGERESEGEGEGERERETFRHKQCLRERGGHRTLREAPCSRECLAYPS